MLKVLYHLNYFFISLAVVSFIIYQRWSWICKARLPARLFLYLPANTCLPRCPSYFTFYFVIILEYNSKYFILINKYWKSYHSYPVISIITIMININRITRNTFVRCLYIQTCRVHIQMQQINFAFLIKDSKLQYFYNLNTEIKSSYI